MKKLVLLMLSLVALFLGAARSAQADDVLDFSPPPISAPRNSAGIALADPEPMPRTMAPKVVKPPVAPAKVVAAKPVQRAAAVIRNDRSADDRAEDAVSFQVRQRTDRVHRPTVPIDRPMAVAAPPIRSSAARSANLFEGGSESLVARAVGSAEGTRTPDGGKTWAYYGHVDPGNGVWNLGSFSYQHEARSPEDADERQLDRLRRQFDIIQTSALSQGLQLSLEEQLNAIDLANQAPLAALAQGGYIDRLRQAYRKGLRGTDAVIHARTYAFVNPQTQQWDAPGLGNREESISRDQARRFTAIAEAVTLHLSSR